jgi:hypothetical protein
MRPAADGVKIHGMAKAKATALGWHNLAESYRIAARHLAEAKVRSTHRDMPVRFLYYHAIELFLKSYLVLHRYSEVKLRQIGHEVKTLAAEGAWNGLHFDDEDKEVIELIAEGTTIFDARYPRIGGFRWPAVEALDRTAASLHDSVRTALRAAGQKVR